MPQRLKREAVQADASLAQARKTSPLFKKLLTSQQGVAGHDHSPSIRHDHYKGHHIVVKTTYDVTIDGKKFTPPLDVSNAGTVQYHGMPNVGFPSALDLLKCIIDQFPEEFPAGGREKPAVSAQHHGHAHATGGKRKRVKTK